MQPGSLLAVGTTLLSLVVPIVAQASLPSCAAICFASALSNQTVCLPIDTECICNDQLLNTAIQNCVLRSCTLKESLSALNTTNTRCDIPVRDRSSNLIIVNAIFGALALIALAIRMLVSIRQEIFGHDDFCAVVAYAFAAPITYGQLACGILGFGKDTWAVPPENIYLIMKIVYFNQLSYFISSSSSKLCFLFMFLRIFPAERTRKLVFVGIVLSALFVLAFGIPMTFACKPISAVWTSWDRETPYDYCISQRVFWFSAAGYNIAVDVFIVIIPIPDLLQLALSTRKKFMLVAIFSTGIVTIIVSIARLWALAHYGSSTNPIYDNMLSGIFSPLELNVGIICMCMPAFRRFVARYFSSCFGSFVFSNPKSRQYEDETPQLHTGLGPWKSQGGKKHRDTLGGSLFQTTTTTTTTTITNTVDMNMKESRRSHDEIKLMGLKRQAGGAEHTDTISGRGPESLHKAQNRDALEKEK